VVEDAVHIVRVLRSRAAVDLAVDEIDERRVKDGYS